MAGGAGEAGGVPPALPHLQQPLVGDDQPATAAQRQTLLPLPLRVVRHGEAEPGAAAAAAGYLRVTVTAAVHQNSAPL